ncbi:MAG: hypothetical protein QOF77_890 [Solirubrobacteraceae bacterium]|jgi:hypothetical protein|nr:hypothetical protein [Solirubrobacteraceae bacterium]
MPTRAVFRCQFCDASPDHGTQRSLQGQVTERMFGEYLDAFPGRWLVWNGGGPLGPRRYACRMHRGDLVAYLRYHYATVAAQVWKMPPYQQRWPDEKRPHMGGSMGIIKFGLRGGLLEDKPPAPPKPAPLPATAPEAVAPKPDPLPDAAPPEPAPAAESPPSHPEMPADPFGPDELLPPAEDLFPPGELFPPADLFPPTDEPFPPGGGEGWPPDGLEDEQWPPDFPPGEHGDPWPPEPDPPPA